MNADEPGRVTTLQPGEDMSYLGPFRYTAFSVLRFQVQGAPKVTHLVGAD